MPASEIKKRIILLFLKISVYKIFIHKNILVDKLSVNIINQIYIKSINLYYLYFLNFNNKQ